MNWINTADDYESMARPEPAVVACTDGRKISVPCTNILLVAPALLRANAYNPNSIPPDRMELLRTSIVDNGFCFPIVTIWDPDDRTFVVIDGFHRSLIGGGEWLGMSHVPVVVLEHDITARMNATMQFNRARGVHQVDMDADVIRALAEQGLSDAEISEKIGIDEDSVYRYKQMTGVAELFAKVEYSTAWEVEERGD